MKIVTIEMDTLSESSAQVVVACHSRDEILSIQSDSPLSGEDIVNLLEWVGQDLKLGIYETAQYDSI
tara:strand:+ start:20 stop:220 length:201 start_codon:yes stop_codon:yes gene_type:complete